MGEVPGVDIPLGVKDETQKGMASVKKTLSSAFGDIAKQAAGFLARDAVNSIATFGKEALKAAADSESMKKSFDALRGATGNMASTTDTLREATGGLVNDTELMTAANQFMNLNLPVGKMEEMWEAAMKVGRSMGIDATQAIGDFNTAVGRASPLILDNFGITLSAAEAQTLYAEKLGKTTEELTDSERKMAFQAAAIDKLMDKAGQLGDNTSSLGDTWGRFNATMDNFQTAVGTALLPILADILEKVNSIMPAVQGLIEAIRGGDWESIGNIMRDAFTDAVASIRGVIDSIDWEEVFISLGEFLADLPFMIGRALFNLGGVLGTIIKETDWDSVFSGMWEGWSNFIGSLAVKMAQNLMALLPKWVQDILAGPSGGGAADPGSAPGGIPGLASGGIVTKPTLAMIGEAGPEAVVPLGQGGFGGGTTVTINKLADSLTIAADNVDEIADMLLDAIGAKLALKGIRTVPV